MRLTFEDRLKMCEDHVLRGKSLSHISEENGNYDEETQTLMFETDRFSTYAIFYDEGNASGLWWLLLLTLIPLGYFGYQYRGFIKGKSIIIMGKVKKVSHLIKSKVTK